MKDKNLDDIVDKIAERVLARLEKSTDVTIDCLKNPDGCVHCGLCIIKNPDAVENIVQNGATRIGSNIGINHAVNSNLAQMIDHTILKPETTRDELKKVCDEAKQYHFATVCVNASNIPFVARQLKGNSVKPIAVVGFPLGAATPQAKAFESKQAIQDGAEEIDMVVNIGALKSKDYKMVYNDISAVVEASKPHKVKVILETSKLDFEEKVAACVLSKTAGAAFVKTSTGFGGGGATVEDIALMRKVVGMDMEVKASGGIRTKEDAEAMIKAGANRIGASASVAIVTGEKSKKSGY